MFQHQVLGLGVLDPVLARLQVHRAQLPALDRVVGALDEAALLFLIADGEPVLDQNDAGPHQHVLEHRAGVQELLVFLVGAETHDLLDAGAVVPAPVEQDDLALGGQLRDVALEVPLAALALGRGAEGDDAADSGVEALGDSLDDAALAGGIAAFEDDADLQALDPHPFLELDQFELKAGELVDVFVLLHRLFREAAMIQAMPMGFDGGGFPRVGQHFPGDIRPVAPGLLAVRPLVAHGRFSPADAPARNRRSMIAVMVFQPEPVQRDIVSHAEFCRTGTSGMSSNAA